MAPGLKDASEVLRTLQKECAAMSDSLMDNIVEFTSHLIGPGQGAGHDTDLLRRLVAHVSDGNVGVSVKVRPPCPPPSLQIPDRPKSAA